MNVTRIGLCGLGAVTMGLAIAGEAHAQVANSSAVDAAFTAFWAAGDPATAAKQIDAIVASGVSFDEARARLEKGRPYSAAVPTGRRDLTHRIAERPGSSGGLAHPYTIIVPESYDPSRAYPVRVQLHGGVGRPLGDPPQGGGGAARIPGTVDQIYVLPNAWPESMWWFGTQTNNLETILDRLKRSYNVDENRVYLTGISDGGTGTYFFAFRDPMPFASFLPLNGQMLVLANRDAEADGDIFPGNAINKPFFVVNGGKDPLYPAASVRPYVEHLKDLGAEVVFHVQEEAGHNTSWWPEERASFESFVAAHPRDPLPDRLSWETERVDRYNRFDWLVIDRLGRTASDVTFADANTLDLRGIKWNIFPQSAASGRVDLVRRGNTVEATTRDVRTFTLLLSPDRFDFGQPVKVIVNGRMAFEGRVTPSVRTLLEWAARDNDRTALYGASLQIEVAK